jgi:hypothetical protein
VSTAPKTAAEKPEPKASSGGTLYISEYIDLLVVGGRAAPVVLEPAIAEQTIAIGRESTQSKPFHTGAKFVRLHTDAPCSVRFGSDPVATSSSGRLHGTEYRGVTAGLKVAVISNS